MCVLSILDSRRRSSPEEPQPAPKSRSWFIRLAAGIQLGAVAWTTVRAGPSLWIFWAPAILFGVALGLLRLRDWHPSRKGRLAQAGSWSIKTWKKLFWVAIVLHIVIALLFVNARSGDFIDVFLFQQDGAHALLRGIDPYTITHANIYDANDAARFYPPGVVWGGRLHWGYNYPPASLFFALPGYLLGDVRYSQIAALILSALLMVRIQPNRWTIGAACILLLSPLSFWVEMNSWIEPFVLFALTLTVYAAARRSRWLPLALGVFLVSKQFVVVGIPFVLFLQPLDRKQNLKLLARTAAVAVLITAPLALWDLRSFIQGAVVLLLRAPARADSLSLSVFVHLSPFVVYGLVASAIVFCLLAAARTPAMFAACFATVLLVWMFLNKMAFANYYFLIAHALWLAGAVSSASARASAEQFAREEGLSPEREGI